MLQRIFRYILQFINRKIDFIVNCISKMDKFRIVLYTVHLGEEDSVWKYHKRGCYQPHNTWNLTKIVLQVRSNSKKIRALKSL